MSHLTSNRLHALDAVRAIALLLGVVLHSAMSFIPGPPVWIVQDASAAPQFALAFYVPHIFRMALFFMIAGYFARFVLERRSVLAFSLDRAKRIAAPLVTLWLPLLSLIMVVVVWSIAKANGGVMPEGETPPLTLGTFPLTHLWFLYVLVILYAVSLPLTALIRRIDRKDLTGRIIDRITGVLAASPLGILALALPIGAWFATTPFWMQWFGIPTPDTGLIPNNGALIAFGTAFAAGWAVRRRSDLVLSAWKRSWIVNLVLAIGLTVYCIVSLGMVPHLMPAAPGSERMLYSAAYALAIWAWCFALVGLAMVVFDRPSRTWRYLADSSYWVYLMHLPLVMALQVALSDIALPGALKLAIILAVTMTLLLGSYQLLVRNTWLGGWLNGRRHGRTRTEPAAAAASAHPAG